MPRSLNQDDWQQRAAAVRIEWEAPVTDGNAKTPARCLMCGHRWEDLPNNIRRGHGCPVCGGVPFVSQAEWDRRAAAAGIAWEAPVANGHTKTPARCVACGARWSVWPKMVREGRGCPACGRTPVDD